MADTPTTAAVEPGEVCGCPIVSILSEENRTYLAIGPGGRGVVLKKLDSDCLIAGALHPAVRDRLGHARGLAHPGVANLFGVERDGADAYLMWEYVEGVPFLEYVSSPERSPREVASLARELILTVDLLHMQGIVHGALISGNVIVTPGGTVRLTHVSPLLYTQPSVDADCLISILEQAVEARNEQGSPMARLLAEVRSRPSDLRALGTKLANLIEPRGASVDLAGPDPIAGPRKRALFGAAFAGLVGLAAAAGAWYAIERGHLTPLEGLFPIRTANAGK